MKNLNSNLKLYFIALVVLLNACKSDCPNITCTSLDIKYKVWLPYNINDSIKFINNLGTEFLFRTKSIESSTESTQKCWPVPYGGCVCAQCDIKPHYCNLLSSDTSRKEFINGQQNTIIYNGIDVLVTSYNSNSEYVNLIYHVLDQYNSFVISPQIVYQADYSILPTYTIGSKTYTDVIVHQTDTSIVNYIGFVWKSFYNKQYGVIAFEDRKTHSLFYRTY
jgi:hypothetical protein